MNIPLFALGKTCRDALLFTREYVSSRICLLHFGLCPIYNLVKYDSQSVYPISFASRGVIYERRKRPVPSAVHGSQCVPVFGAVVLLFSACLCAMHCINEKIVVVVVSSKALLLVSMVARGDPCGVVR